MMVVDGDGGVGAAARGGAEAEAEGVAVLAGLTFERESVALAALLAEGELLLAGRVDIPGGELGRGVVAPEAKRHLGLALVAFGAEAGGDVQPADPRAGVDEAAVLVRGGVLGHVGDVERQVEARALERDLPFLRILGAGVIQVNIVFLAAPPPAGGEERQCGEQSGLAIHVRPSSSYVG